MIEIKLTEGGIAKELLRNNCYRNYDLSMWAARDIISSLAHKNIFCFGGEGKIVSLKQFRNYLRKYHDTIYYQILISRTTNIKKIRKAKRKEQIEVCKKDNVLPLFLIFNVLVGIYFIIKYISLED